MAWINEFLQTWIYKLRRCIGADRCRFFYGAINSHMARSASGEAKIFLPLPPFKNTATYKSSTTVYRFAALSSPPLPHR